MAMDNLEAVGWQINEITAWVNFKDFVLIWTRTNYSEAVIE